MTTMKMTTKAKRTEALSPHSRRDTVKITKTLAATPLLLAGAALYHAPAEASMCALPDAGAPAISANPKPFTIPPPSTCLVSGLPGVAAELPGYILVASTTRSIVSSGVTVGTLYDRVYCLGTGTTCNATNTYIIATRAHMSGTPNFPARNPNCPVWSGTSNDCFEINNYFRNIRGTSGTPVAADVGYWMGPPVPPTGCGSTTSANPDCGVSTKYMEYTGKTYKGINEFTPPGVATDRDNTKAMFWADTNIFDPDGGNSEWSPWLYVRQNCPFGGATPHYNEPAFAIKYWQGGEETQIPKNIQAQAYACKTS
jgi:hypothetical protein